MVEAANKRESVKADLLIRNGTVVTLGINNDVIADGAIAIRNGLIIGIGTSSALGKEYVAQRTIEARGQVIMPGLVNSHTHIAAPVFRGYIEDREDALYNIAFPVEELLSPSDIYTLSLLGCLEVLRFGTTCINDIFHHSEKAAQAANEVGLRAVVAHKVADIKLSEIGSGVYRHVPDEGEERMNANLQLIENWHGKSNGRITCRIGTHATDTCTPELLSHGRDLANDYGVGMHIHVAQSESELARVEEIYGDNDCVALLESLGVLGPDVITVHCTHITDNGVRLLAERDAKYVMCPTRALRRGGMLPIAKMRDAGVTSGIGTDWIRMDPWEAMRATVAMVEIIRRESRTAGLSAIDVLRLATIDGARVLGMEEEIGSLEVGKKADITLINTEQPHLVPMYQQDLFKGLAYHVNGSDVDTVIVDGEIVLDAGVVCTVDEESILQEASMVCSKIRAQASKELGL